MKVEGYLVIVGKRHYLPCRGWIYRIMGFRKNKPALEKNQAALKIVLDIPDGIFDEFEPEVKIDVPPHLVAKPEITAEAVKPGTDA